MPATLVVAGATGWLGQHVVVEALHAGCQVVALVRPATDAAPLLARAAAAGPDAPARLTIARVDVAAPGAADAVAAALRAAAAAAAADPAPHHLALVNALGVRDLAVPEAAIRRVLTAGTAALWAGCVAVAPRVARFVSVAGGIHRAGRAGAPNRHMVHNRAREDALDAAAAEATAAWAAAGSGGAPPATPALTILDPSVFFKDAASIFGMVAAKSPPALTLIAGGWGVRCAPISGRDLAAALVGVALADRTPDDPPVVRFSVGGPEALTFGELADAAAAAATGDPGAVCRRVTLPRWAAWAAWRGAALAGAAGSKRCLALARFLSFLWVVCTDASPGGLVGEVRVGADTVRPFFEELAAARRREGAAAAAAAAGAGG